MWTNIGFIYDPAGDPGTGQGTWSAQLTEVFGSGRIGDSMCIVLENGTYVLSDIATGNLEALNPATLTYTALNPPGKADQNNEENWNILPNGTLLTVDARISSQSELYDPIANSWGNAVSTVVNMADVGTNTNSAEVGPGVLRPDGTLIYFSGNNLGQNALYNAATNTWTNAAAMDFPLVAGQTYHYAVPDGPAAILPNGNVLVMGSPATNVQCGPPGTPPPPPTCGVFNTPSHFWEFDFATNTLVQVADSPNAASFKAYQGHFLVLPTGELLMTSYDQAATQDVLLYSNGGAPQDAWRPVITQLPPTTLQPGTTYAIVASSSTACRKAERTATTRRCRRTTRWSGSGTTRPATCSTPGPTTTARWASRRWAAPRSRRRSSTYRQNRAGGVDAGRGHERHPVGALRGGRLGQPSAGCGLPERHGVGQRLVPGGRHRVAGRRGIVDPDGDNINCVLSPPGPFALGNTGVTLTCTDPFGLSDDCTATVTVADNTPPVLNCPVSVNVLCTNASGAVATFTTSATDNCGSVGPVACAPPSGSNFPLGTTLDNCSASDGRGNTGTCSFNVTVALGDNPTAAPRAPTSSWAPPTTTR